MLAGATADSCAVSVPLAELCAVSGPGARQPHYLGAGTAGRWGGWTGAGGDVSQRERLTGPLSVSLNIRPRSKVELGLGPAVWG